MGKPEHNMQDYDEFSANFSIEVPDYYNFGYDVIDAWARKDRNRLAMIWVDQQGNEKKFSFHDLKRLSNQAANILLKYGVKKGDRVMLILPRVPEWWIFVIALIKLGAVYCPCPTMLTPKDIRYRVNAGKFKMIITDLENSSKVEEICNECPTLTSRFLVDGELPGWASYPYELYYPAPVSHRSVAMPVERKTKSTDPMLIYFTSGTTGQAKMVLHNNAHPLGHIVTARLWQDITENDLHFSFSDTGWAKAGWGKIFGQWIEGACIFVYHITGKFNATEILPLAERYDINTFCCPPTVYRMLVIADIEKYDLREMRHCISAGEPLNPEVIRIWKEGTGLNIYEGYGQTETCCCIAVFPCMEPKAGSMGKPTPGWNIELHDDEGNPVGDHEEGRIAINLNPRPVGLFVEYLDNDEANRESFVNGFYYTGDKAYRDEDGYFWFVGRDDDVIKSSGYRIGPFEVESALLEHPAVQESAVVGSPDLIRGLVVKAFVVLNEGFEPSESLVKELQRHVRNSTAPYKYPRAVEFVTELPKTLSGKIKRNVLREMEFQRSGNSQ
jgi:acetyl-CoA synthetase